MTAPLDSIRDPSIGAEWLAYYALTEDEPMRFAVEYMKTAHSRLGRALAQCRDASGERLIPKEAEEELSAVHLFLVGLSMAADPEHKTPVNVKLVRRRGRPKRDISKVVKYRTAATKLLSSKKRGYDAAAREVAQETGLDRTEIEAWASHIEGQRAAVAIAKFARFFRRAI